MVDCGFYTGAYGGTSIPEGEFPALALRAQAQLDRYKRIYQVTVPEGSEKAEDKAVCAMADALYYFDTAAAGELSGSVSVGSVSTSRGQGTIPDLSQKAQEKELYRCARLYLDIYRGC